MLRLSSSSTAGLWLSLLRKNTRMTFWTMVTAALRPPRAEAQSAEIRASKRRSARLSSRAQSGFCRRYNILSSTSGRGDHRGAGSEGGNFPRRSAEQSRCSGGKSLWSGALIGSLTDWVSDWVSEERRLTISTHEEDNPPPHARTCALTYNWHHSEDRCHVGTET